jgi:hypothetical protein
MREVVLGASVVGLCLAAATPAGAQERQPLPPVVVDVRGFYTGLGRDPVTAADLFVGPSALPSRGLGGTAGVTFYPIRRRTVSLGLGAEGILARGSAEADPADPEEEGEEGAVTPPLIHQRILGLSGVVSLNFGHRDGWSYLSAGIGPLSFATYEGDAAPAQAPPRQMTLHYGAGARWFAWRHFAFTFDLRFYKTEPEVLTPFYPGRQRSTLRVLSAGVSIR